MKYIAAAHKRLALWGGLLIIATNIVIGIVQPLPALAADARMVDMAHLDFGGRGFIDNNPYDDNFEFVSTDDNCDADTIRVGSNGTVATLRETKRTEAGCITQDQRQISLDATDQKIGAYKLSDNLYIAAEGFTCSGQPGPFAKTDSTGRAEYYKKPTDPAVIAKLPDFAKGAFLRVTPSGELSLEDFLNDNGGGSGTLGTTGCGFGARNGSANVSIRLKGEKPTWDVPTPPQGVTLPSGITPVGDVNPTLPTCESINGAGALSFAFCSIIDVFDKGAKSLESGVDSLLSLPANTFTGESGEKLHQIWSYMRNISSILLILIGLVMVIGQAVTKE